jgi:hypothetical protein
VVLAVSEALVEAILAAAEPEEAGRFFVWMGLMYFGFPPFRKKRERMGHPAPGVGKLVGFLNLIMELA